MTVFEIYDQTIKTLPADDRLRLAKLIIDDLALADTALNTEIPARRGGIRDQEHLELLLLDGLNSGPGIEATPEYWRKKHRTLLEHRSEIVRNG